jgi:hypothetical protein
MTTQVRIFGPNLRDQSKGSFHVHAETCADCDKYKYSDGWHAVVETYEDVAEEVYSDQIAEGLPLDAALQDIHFMPCAVAVLRYRDGWPNERAASRAPRSVRADSEIRERLLKGPATWDGQGWKNGVLYLDTWIVPELDRLIAWCEHGPMDFEGWPKDDDAYSGGVARHPQKGRGRRMTECPVVRDAR